MAWLKYMALLLRRLGIGIVPTILSYCSLIIFNLSSLIIFWVLTFLCLIQFSDTTIWLNLDNKHLGLVLGTNVLGQVKGTNIVG